MWQNKNTTISVQYNILGVYINKIASSQNRSNIVEVM